jgi:hypothetical protein
MGAGIPRVLCYVLHPIVGKVWLVVWAVGGGLLWTLPGEATTKAKVDSEMGCQGHKTKSSGKYGGGRT